MISNIGNVSGKTFDYVIVGGGTAGLTVASRLVEFFPDRTVLVLEAGEPNLDDPKILLGAQFGSTFGDPKYDWVFKTVPQKHASNQVMTWNRGRGLGGTSGMNFYVWTKPPAADMDALEELGNPGWNWKAFKEFTMRTENFSEASADQLKELPHTYKAENRGTSGAIKMTVPGTSVPLVKGFLDTFQNMGVPLIEDPYGGNVSGVWQAACCLDRNAEWTRSYSATAHYLPNKNKSNLTVLTEATVASILSSDSEDGLTATGVEFIYGGTTHSVNVGREVVVSAGTIKTPHILELSGIGRPDILKKIGVPVKVDLPGVGENVQDHVSCSITYELKPSANIDTFDMLRDPAFAAEQTRLQKAGLHNIHRYGISAYSYLPIQLINPNGAPAIVESATKYVEEQIASGKLPPGLAEQYKVQLRLLQDPTLPDVELVDINCFLSQRSTAEEGKGYISLFAIYQHPFSRGTIHARSSDPMEQPDIDGNYFENPHDVEIFKECIKFAQRAGEVEPLKSMVVRQVDPGKENSTDDELRAYLRKYGSHSWHNIGSASMLPRDKNGVVDPKLKVYGTKNIRVADLSVIPLHFASHTQSSAYYVGERLADILKNA